MRVCVFRLFSSAAEGLIQLDGGQDFVVLVVDERQLGLKQALLGGQRFEVACLVGILEQGVDVV